jgi:NAD(P)H-dependent flavin oxidoreductase YrpB (nitropropane dioxygenase family)
VGELLTDADTTGVVVVTVPEEMPTSETLELIGRLRDETEIDVAREFMPAGQGVGAIHDLTPAGELVRRILAEAEIAMDAVQRVRR